MITTSLQIERCQVQAANSWLSKQEIAYVVDNACVDGLAHLACQPTQQRLEAVGFCDTRGSKKSVSQFEVPVAVMGDESLVVPVVASGWCVPP